MRKRSKTFGRDFAKTSARRAVHRRRQRNDRWPGLRQKLVPVTRSAPANENRERSTTESHSTETQDDESQRIANAETPAIMPHRGAAPVNEALEHTATKRDATRRKSVPRSIRLLTLLRPNEETVRSTNVRVTAAQATTTTTSDDGDGPAEHGRRAAQLELPPMGWDSPAPWRPRLLPLPVIDMDAAVATVNVDVSAPTQCLRSTRGMRPRPGALIDAIKDVIRN